MGVSLVSFIVSARASRSQARSKTKTSARPGVVAVNAFLGMSDLPFAEATREVDRLMHGRALMPLAFYHAAWRSGAEAPSDPGIRVH